MGRILLDTCALIWYITDDVKLCSSARAEIEDASNDIFVSKVSLWEVAVKEALKKAHSPFPLSLGAILQHQIYRNNTQTLRIQESHLVYVAAMPIKTSMKNPSKEHGDPWDRLIIAQAAIEKASVITGDPDFLDYPTIKVIWAFESSIPPIPPSYT